MGATTNQGLRLSDLLGALSLATDLGAGVPFEKGLRTCAVASGIAGELGLGPDDRAAVYFASLLRSLGCTAEGSKFAAWFGDDVAVQRELKTLDLDDPAWAGAQRARFAAWAGEARAAELSERFVEVIPRHGKELATGSCEVSAGLGSQLELPAGAIVALDEVYERWDGRGAPSRRRGDELTIAARIVHVAERAVMAHYEGGDPEAMREVQRRAGGKLDPDLCAVFVESAEGILSPLASEDILAEVRAFEPAPRRSVRDPEIEAVCAAFAAFADLKGRFLLGHAAHVADLVDKAAALSGATADTRTDLRLSALLLDLGRVGVSSAVWDRPGRLGPAEWERVRLHPYWTERILRRCAGLEHLVARTAAHHERLDGSGYHRGVRGGELSGGARLLAAADVFAALLEDRPHRPGVSLAEAAVVLRDEVAAGRIDAEAMAAVLEAAGLPRSRAKWPNDLTDREVAVLRVLVRGLSNREIADALVVSPRTVQHQLASVYDKIGVRTRAGAAVFAIEHGLVPTGFDN